MGASGYVLGPRKLAWLSRKTGLDIAHALRGFTSTEFYDVRVRTDECRHYRVNAKTFDVGPPIPCVRSYSSCADWYASRG